MKIELKDRTADTVITYFRATRDPEVRQYLPQKATTEAEALADFEKTRQPGSTSYGRTIYVDGNYIGDVWCYCISPDEPNAMVSYCIFEKAYWGEGIGTEALGLFLAEIAEKFGLKSVGAFTYSANEASIKVLLKNGFAHAETFVEDGIESKYFQKNYRFHELGHHGNDMEIKQYTKERIPDVLQFERDLRSEEDFWGWEIDEKYIADVTAGFENPAFADSLSLLAYIDSKVVGRIDCAMIHSRFDGSVKAYLDWICVIKSYRHRGVAQGLMTALRTELKERGIDTLIGLIAANEDAQRFYRNLPNAKIRDEGIWIDL